MQKLLVTGASGFLGWNICHLAQEKWQVYGTYSSHEIQAQNINFVKIDLTNFSALKSLFKTIQPTAVIHAAAQSKPNLCQQYPEQSYPINVTASLNIAGLCSDLSIPCVFTSTDLVFDGNHPFYKETDPVSPISIYGEQKVKAEEAMAQRYPQTVICRMPLMFGKSSPHSGSFIQGFIQSLKQGKDLNLFIDEFRTPASGATAAKGLLMALETQEHILHLGGKERLSRYEFGRLMAEILELPLEKIQPCRQQDVKMSAPRPVDVSLDSTKAVSLGYNPLSVREELSLLKDKL
ncbi:MAG: NAD(P)-dependent oxidoreductase [Microcoleaceae cyanobacterium]